MKTTDVERVRRRVRGRVPVLVKRCRDALDLAGLGAKGPDPEVALAQLEHVRRRIDAFLRITG